MLQNKTIKKITGLLLALFLIAGQFFVEGASVQAAEDIKYYRPFFIRRAEPEIEGIKWKKGQVELF